MKQVFIRFFHGVLVLAFLQGQLASAIPCASTTIEAGCGRHMGIDVADQQHHDQYAHHHVPGDKQPAGDERSAGLCADDDCCNGCDVCGHCSAGIICSAPQPAHVSGEQPREIAVPLQQRYTTPSPYPPRDFHQS